MRMLSSRRVTSFAALVVAVFVMSASASSAEREPGRRGCTYGLSSIGPVYLRDGKVIGGDTPPHTDSCLP